VDDVCIVRSLTQCQWMMYVRSLTQCQWMMDKAVSGFI